LPDIGKNAKNPPVLAPQSSPGAQVVMCAVFVRATWKLDLRQQFLSHLSFAPSSFVPEENVHLSGGGNQFGQMEDLVTMSSNISVS
jgi:hypothetical protein